jgi:hypothetical protein
VRLITLYPMQTGRNFAEMLRAVDSIQLTTRHPVATPANWQPGEDVMINLMLSDDKAKELAAGIHPPVLDNGLPDALATLAARSAVPVDLVTDITDRPSAAIEAIAYFCAAELLANVAKHSEARHATLEAVHVPGAVGR